MRHPVAESPSPKVFQVLTNLDIGGAQASVSLIACGLRRRGVDVHVVYSSAGGRDPMRHTLLHDQLRDAGVPLHDAGCMRRAVHPWGDWSAVRSLRGLFRRARPDIVHTHMSKAGILGRWAAHAEQVPSVVHTVRGWSFYSASNAVTRLAYISMERYFARRTHTMLAVSPRMIADGLAAGIGSPGLYAVARTGLQVERFAGLREQAELAEMVRRQWQLPTKAQIIGGVMHLTPQKAPLEFVEACARVMRDRADVHVVLVGNGELRDEVDARIGRLGLAGRFHLVGLQADVTPFLTVFDVLLLASHWEGLPRIVLECIAAGIPVVATRVGGTAELESWAGPSGSPVILREAGDVEGLADAVASTLEAGSSLGESGALRSAALPLPREFHLDEVVDLHARIYGELFRRANPR